MGMENDHLSVEKWDTLSDILGNSCQNNNISISIYLSIYPSIHLSIYLILSIMYVYIYIYIYTYLKCANPTCQYYDVLCTSAAAQEEAATTTARRCCFWTVMKGYLDKYAAASGKKTPHNIFFSNHMICWICLYRCETRAAQPAQLS